MKKLSELIFQMAKIPKHSWIMKPISEHSTSTESDHYPCLIRAWQTKEGATIFAYLLETTKERAVVRWDSKKLLDLKRAANLTRLLPLYRSSSSPEDLAWKITKKPWCQYLVKVWKYFIQIWRFPRKWSEGFSFLLLLDDSVNLFIKHFMNILNKIWL